MLGSKKGLFMRAFLSDTAEAVEVVQAVLRSSEHPIARIRTQVVSVAVGPRLGGRRDRLRGL